MKIIVAVTGASGTIYAQRVLEHLLRSDQVEHVALILSQMATQVAKYEGVKLPQDERIQLLSNDDMFAASASGSAGYDAMVVVPASMGSVGRIASGISSSLIERSADVMIKERRRLIIVPREAPYSLIHLRNMTTLTEAGAIILPASPSFYFNPTTIEELCLPVTLRTLELAGLSVTHREWGE